MVGKHTVMCTSVLFLNPLKLAPPPTMSLDTRLYVAGSHMALEIITRHRRLISEITRTAVFYVYMFEVFIAHESKCISINLFLTTVQT